MNSKKEPRLKQFLWPRRKLQKQGVDNKQCILSFARKPLTLARREDLAGRFLVLPTLIILAVVVLGPLLASIAFSFQKFRLVELMTSHPWDLTWTLDNFISALRSDGFWEAFGVTLVYSVGSTIGTLVVGLMVALSLRRPFFGRGIVRALALVPYVLPVVAAAMIWKQMFNTQYGLVNAFGQKFLHWDKPISFLSTDVYHIGALPVPLTLLIVIAFEIWKTAPLAYLFFTARLTAVSRELEEAAIIDGATPSQQLRYILLPQLKGVILLMGILRFIWSFQSFNEIYLLTGGAGGTQVLAVRIYQYLTSRGDIGSSSALGVLMMLILCVLLIVYIKVSGREGNE